jgi:hypothetical protein
MPWLAYVQAVVFFLSSRKYDPGCSSWIRILDPDLDFLPILNPGVKKAPDPGSAATLRTGTRHPFVRVLSTNYIICCNRSWNWLETRPETTRKPGFCPGTAPGLVMARLQIHIQLFTLMRILIRLQPVLRIHDKVFLLITR